MKDKQQQIKKEIEKILKCLKLPAKVATRKKDNVLFFDIQTEEAGLIIGSKGENLASLQHVIQLISYKKYYRENEIFKFIIDVNSYKQQKLAKIKELAQNIAQKVLQYKKPEVLRPMNAYERRVVHLEIANTPGLVTESIGVSPERRIIVRLKPSRPHTE